MSAADFRLPDFTFHAPAGVTLAMEFISPTALTSLSVYLGGSLADLDSFTGATEYTATIGDVDAEGTTIGTDRVATVNVDIPSNVPSTPARLVINGAVESSGQCYPDTAGRNSPSTYSVTLAASTITVNLTIPGVVESGGITDGDKGDITVSSSGAVWTIDNGVVTYAKMQNVSATGRFLGRDTAGAGNVEEITPAAARAILNVEDGATADQTAGQIKTAYESNADTNAFTDNEKTKLSNIETGATADQSAAEIKTAYESNADTNAYTDAEKTVVGNTSGTNTGDEPSATDTAEGVVELATEAETVTGTDTARATTPAGVKAAVDNATSRVTIPADKTTSYTATAADAGASTGMSAAGALTVTINTGVFTAGDLAEYRQVGAGQVTIAAGAGVTLRAPSGAKTRAQYSPVQVLALGGETFSVTGDVTT